MGDRRVDAEKQGRRRVSELRSRMGGAEGGVFPRRQSVLISVRPTECSLN